MAVCRRRCVSLAVAVFRSESRARLLLEWEFDREVSLRIVRIHNYVSIHSSPLPYQCTQGGGCLMHRRVCVHYFRLPPPPVCIIPAPYEFLCITLGPSQNSL